MNAPENMTLGWDVLYELLRFRWDNTPAYWRGGLQEPVKDLPVTVSDDELRSLILFAAGQWHGDPTNPRQLAAYLTIRLVPEPVGEALFGRRT